MSEAAPSSAPAVAAPAGAAPSPPAAAQPAPTAASTPATEPAPVATAVLAAEPPKTEAAPAAPAAEPAKAEAPKAEAAPSKPEDVKPSLLSQEDKPAAAEPAKDAAPDKKDAAPAEPAPAPTYESFVYPDGLRPADQDISRFNDMLGRFEVASKAIHSEVQKFGQELVNFHVAELQRAQQEQWNVFHRQQEAWVSDLKKDPELGGDKVGETVGRALNVIKEFGGTEAQLKQLRLVLTATGAGNHPAVVRLFNNIGKKLTEQAVPVLAAKPAQVVPMNKARSRYQGTVNNG